MEIAVVVSFLLFLKYNKDHHVKNFSPIIVSNLIISETLLKAVRQQQLDTSLRAQTVLCRVVAPC